MMQSILQEKLHVAIIMDGNGRWATGRGLPRRIGHRIGVETVRRIVEAAPRLGIGTLTLYAFSADNWRRPESEVSGLMSLFRRYMRTEAARLVRAGVRVTAIGRRDRLPDDLVAGIDWVETTSAGGQALHLRIALDYSSRDEILRAAAAAEGVENFTRDGFSRLLSGGAECRDVDLLIRPGGEKRLSDFLLWECAYAELYFTDVLWPDFRAEDLERGLADFYERSRRFGALPDAGAVRPARVSAG
jgi:undecaprenyl diphosphate synthase